MPRYIDADALLEDIEQTVRFSCRDGVQNAEMRGANKIIDRIKAAPTVSPDEVRGVVHCRECDLWNRLDSAGRESLGNLTCSCAHWTVEDGAVIHTKPTDFCSYGERMVSDDA